MKESLKKSTLRISSTTDEEVIWHGLLSDLPTAIETDSASIKLELHPKTKGSFRFGIHYATNNINFRKIYCTDTITIEAPALIEDGSGHNNYKPNSECKWHIKPSEGFDIGIEFLELNTQLNNDSIYLFRGHKTLQTAFLMRVSGTKLPPKAIIEHGDALLWFVSDSDNQGQGFKIKVTNEPKLARKDSQ